MSRIIRAAQIDFSDLASAAVVSENLRFVLPVPPLEGGGELLVGPDGETLTDRDGAAIEGRGIVFFDPDDQSWEVAPGDGTGVLLFSPITREQGAKLGAYIATLAPNPRNLRLEQLKAVIRFVIEELRLRSAYSSTRAYVAEAMAAAGKLRSGSGLHQRKRDICRAVHIAGKGSFLGPAASPQRFADGVVIVKHGDSVRAVQPISFEANYQFLDGRPARMAELPTQAP